MRVVSLRYEGRLKMMAATAKNAADAAITTRNRTGTERRSTTQLLTRVAPNVNRAPISGLCRSGLRRMFRKKTAILWLVWLRSRDET